MKVNGVDVEPAFYENTDAGTSRSATRTRIDERERRSRCICSSASTPKATISGTRRRARNQRFENIYALPRLHALFARHGVRPTYVITYPVATDARSADVLRALLGGRRLRDRRAPSRVGNAAVHGRGRRAAIRTRRICRCAQFEAAARVADRRDRRGRRRSGRCRTDPGRFGFSAAHVAGARAAAATWSNRASRRCSTRRTRAGRTSSRRR